MCSTPNRVIFGWTKLFLAELLRFGTSYDKEVGMDLKRVTSSFQRYIHVNAKTRLSLLLSLHKQDHIDVIYHLRRDMFD